jgi:hypothetical protein
MSKPCGSWIYWHDQPDPLTHYPQGRRALVEPLGQRFVGDGFAHRVAAPPTTVARPRAMLHPYSPIGVATGKHGDRFFIAGPSTLCQGFRKRLRFRSTGKSERVGGCGSRLIVIRSELCLIDRGFTRFGDEARVGGAPVDRV